VVDHVSEYDRQSERRKINSEMGWVGKEKDLSEMFGLSQEGVEDFDVQLDLFDYGAKEGPRKELKREDGAKTVEAKGTQGKLAGVREKIDKEFEGVGEEGEDDLDLLEMMDS
jgi:hypothetical protein